MSSLLPNNATPQEVALDLATARIGNVDVPIRTLWDPENCPADILPWLAWAFSVDKWDATWTEAQKRAIVAAAIFVHRRKGTPAAVKEVVSAIFGGGDVIEAWQDVDLTAHEFKIVTTGTLQSEAQFVELIDLVDGAKPVRSHLVAVQIQSAPTGDLFFGTASRLGGKTTLRGRLAIDPDALDLFYGVATRYATRTTIDAQDPSFAVNGFEPEFVASFAKSSPDVKRWNYYRANGVEVDFSKAFDFARAGGATYVDATGTLQTAAANVPRVGHHVWNGSAWVNEGLLHESEARTNSLPRNDFDGAVVGVIGSGGFAPTGTFFSNTLGSGAVTEVVAAGTEFGMSYIDVRWQGTATATPQTCTFNFNVASSVPASIGQTWTASCFARIVGGSYPSGAGEIFRFTIAERAGGTGVVFTTVNVDAPTETLARFSGAYTLTDATADNLTAGLELRVSSGAVVDVTIRYYMPQLEQGATPSSPIPTSGSTVTRAAETLTIPAANLPWNPVAVSIQMEGRVTYADTDKFGEVRFFSWGLFPADQIRHDLDTNGSDIGQFRSYQLASSVDSSVTGPIDSYSPGVLVPFNLAGRHGSTFVNGAVDGTALTANTTPTALPDLSDTNLLLGQAFMGTVRTFRMWGTDIGDAGIAEASA